MGRRKAQLDKGRKDTAHGLSSGRFSIIRLKRVKKPNLTSSSTGGKKDELLNLEKERGGGHFAWTLQGEKKHASSLSSKG